MSRLSTQEFKIHMANQFLESLTEPANTMYYMFASQPQPWEDENDPPDISQTVSSLSYDVYDNMVFGKIINPSNIKLMANRHDWVANTVYARYDDREDLSNSSFLS